MDGQYPPVGTPAGGSFAAAIDLASFVDALLDHRLLSDRYTALLLNDFDTSAADGGLPVHAAWVNPVLMPLEDAPEAHIQSETRRTRGKIVLNVAGG